MSAGPFSSNDGVGRLFDFRNEVIALEDSLIVAARLSKLGLGCAISLCYLDIVGFGLGQARKENQFEIVPSFVPGQLSIPWSGILHHIYPGTL